MARSTPPLAAAPAISLPRHLAHLRSHAYGASQREEQGAMQGGRHERVTAVSLGC